MKCRFRDVSMPIELYSNREKTKLQSQVSNSKPTFLCETIGDRKKKTEQEKKNAKLNTKRILRSRLIWRKGLYSVPPPYGVSESDNDIIACSCSNKCSSWLEFWTQIFEWKTVVRETLESLNEAENVVIILYVYMRGNIGREFRAMSNTMRLRKSLYTESNVDTRSYFGNIVLLIQVS